MNSIAIEMNKSKSSNKGLFWAFLPVGLLGSLLVGLFSIVALAVRDPSFAVEEDYYQKAVHWDRHQAQQRRNAELEFDLKLETAPVDAERTMQLELHAKDRYGRPITGARVEVEAFFNGLSGVRHQASLREGPLGYSGEIPWEHSGLWEFRVEIRRGTDVYTQVIRKDVGPAK